MYKFLNFLILYILLSKTMVFAQEKETGVDIGYGISGVHINETIKYFVIGLNYSSHPVKAPFAIKTGITYDFRGNKEINLNYIRTPLGLDFIIGRKFNFIIGGGFYVSYLISYKETESLPNFNETNRRLQFGWEANAGLAYQISKKIKVCIMPQINIDITKMYDYPDLSPGGASTPYAVKGGDIFCKIGIKYNIGKN